MINFFNIDNSEPYSHFKKSYDSALKKNQRNIEAIVISSFCPQKNQVDSRFVNLKMVLKTDFIFFSNYESPKSKQFNLCDEISALFYWNSINMQIRMQGKIEKTSEEFNQNYFRERSKEKNALAISSRQSEVIESYETVKENYENVLSSSNLEICPEYWGGFSFKPRNFEFWEGNKNRLNKRIFYSQDNLIWKKQILQP